MRDVIGGNVQAELMTARTQTNAIGEHVRTWKTVAVLRGYLDFTAGDAKSANYHTKLQETTHVFLCDYKPLPAASENARMVIDGKTYDVLRIDDPMGLHQHMEIMLKYTGGQAA